MTFELNSLPNLQIDLLVTSCLIDNQHGLVIVGADGGVYVTPTSTFHVPLDDSKDEEVTIPLSAWRHVLRTSSPAIVRGQPDATDPNTYSQVFVCSTGGNAVHVLSWPDLTMNNTVVVPVAAGEGILSMQVNTSGAVAATYGPSGSKTGTLWVSSPSLKDKTYPNVESVAISGTHVYCICEKRILIISFSNGAKSYIDVTLKFNPTSLCVCEDHLVVCDKAELALLPLSDTTRHRLVHTDAFLNDPSEFDSLQPSLVALPDTMWSTALVIPPYSQEIALFQSWNHVPCSLETDNATFPCASDYSSYAVVSCGYDTTCTMTFGALSTSKHPVCLLFTSSTFVCRFVVNNTSHKHRRDIQPVDSASQQTVLKRLPSSPKSLDVTPAPSGSKPNLPLVTFSPASVAVAVAGPPSSPSIPTLSFESSLTEFESKLDKISTIQIKKLKPRTPRVVGATSSGQLEEKAKATQADAKTTSTAAPPPPPPLDPTEQLNAAFAEQLEDYRKALAKERSNAAPLEALLQKN
eukprot:PhF_6_TR27166/c1_g1_i6/m.39780